MTNKTCWKFKQSPKDWVINPDLRSRSRPFGGPWVELKQQVGGIKQKPAMARIQLLKSRHSHDSLVEVKDNIRKIRGG